MRKKKQEGHENHERWLVSYADFITLLFAFFVVMFSVSHVDSQRMGQFTESFSLAVGLPIGGALGHGVLPGADMPGPSKAGTQEPVPSALEQLYVQLTRGSEGGEMEGVTIVMGKNDIVLRFAEAITFASGDDRLKDPAVRALHRIADVLRPRAVDIRVEGHTDDVPIKNGRFRSNWDLSTARATAVIAELVGPGNIPPARLAAAGYAEYHPVAPNTTAEQRAQNRRVDLVLTLTPEPAAAQRPATVKDGAPSGR